jgi:hypothetical protein
MYSPSTHLALERLAASVQFSLPDVELAYGRLKSIDAVRSVCEWAAVFQMPLEDFVTSVLDATGTMQEAGRA